MFGPKDLHLYLYKIKPSVKQTWPLYFLCHFGQVRSLCGGCVIKVTLWGHFGIFVQKICQKYPFTVTEITHSLKKLYIWSGITRLDIPV